MPCFDPWGDILTKEEVECLEQASIILPQIPSQYNTGRRTVSRSIFSLFDTPSTTSGERSSPSATARIHSGPSSNYTQIPLIRNGPAVLEYLGFNAEASRVIWQRFDGRPDPQQCPDSLLDYARSQANSLNRPPFTEMPIEEALVRIGLNEEVVDAIADPEYADIRGTASLSFWVTDTIETNYATLLRWQSLLKRYARDRIASKTNGKEKGKENGKKATPGIGVEQRPSATAACRQQGTLTMGLQDFGLPAAHVTIIEGDPLVLPDHAMLFKGKSLKNFVNEEDVIWSDGSINLMPLATPPAEGYRCWAARRNPRSETCIIQIQIPRSFPPPTLTSNEIWYNDEWKELVWYSKNRKRPHPDLRSLLDADKIYGHIYSGDARNIRTIPLAEVKTRITEDNLLKRPVGPGFATQVMFTPNAIGRLEAELKGKIHFDIFHREDESA